MKKFKIITPKGFSFGDKIIKEGETFDAEHKSSNVRTGLHFKQIEEVIEKPAKEPKEPKEPAK